MSNQEIDKQKIKREHTVLAGQIFMAISVFLFGLSYDFSVFLFAVGLLIFLFILFKKNRGIKIVIGKPLIMVFLFCGCNLLAAFVGVERGIGIIGFFRVLLVLLWILVLMQYSSEEKNEILLAVPYAGVVMVLLCILCYPLQSTREWVFHAGRMGGLFQYSNTFALYLLIGIIIISYKNQNLKRYYLMIGVLLFGILWSGSRSVFIFTFIAMLFLAYRNKNKRIPLIVILLCIIMVALLYVYLTGNTDAFSRFTTISIDSSTFLGRILYCMDALPLIWKHPLGLGYMGYYFLQPQIQHGVYTTRYVHNDWIQIGLDGGILAIILFFILVIGNIILQWKKNERNVFVIVLVSMHMLMDFDLEFGAILVVLFTCMDWYGRERKITYCKWYYVPGVCILAVYGWLLLATGFDYIGKEELSLKIYPWNSEVETKVMLQSKTSAEAEDYADHILTENEYSYAAYNVKAVAAMDREEYAEMLKYKRRALEITRYTLEEYKDYVVMLKIALEAYEQQGDFEQSQECVNNLLQVEGMLKAVEQNTNPLAYRLDEKPDLKLPEEYREYIQLFD
ncbi:MAG: O-antigen ligase family protein [Clostridiales bacterium]|nr:O-antigen ligase family protein [Clostridiales bacterium]